MIINNYVRISGIKIDDSSSLGRLDVSYEAERHFNLWYKIEDIGKISKVDVLGDDYCELDVQIKVGDECLFRWYDIQSAYVNDLDIIPYDGIVAVRREDGSLMPINGNVLYERLDTPLDSKKSVSNTGRVVSVATDIKRYVGYDGISFKADDIQVDDYIFMGKSTGREIEHIFHQKEERKLFVVQSKDIMMISDTMISE